MGAKGDAGNVLISWVPSIWIGCHLAHLAGPFQPPLPSPELLPATRF